MKTDKDHHGRWIMKPESRRMFLDRTIRNPNVAMGALESVAHLIAMLDSDRDLHQGRSIELKRRATTEAAEELSMWTDEFDRLRELSESLRKERDGLIAWQETAVQAHRQLSEYLKTLGLEESVGSLKDDVCKVVEKLKAEKEIADGAARALIEVLAEQSS